MTKYYCLHINFIHYFTIFSNNANTIGEWSDLGRLPPIEVLEKTRDVLKLDKCEVGKYPAVSWNNYGTFTLSDINLMIQLSKFFLEQKRNVKQIQGMRSSNTLPPVGLPDISREINCSRFYDLILLEPLQLQSSDWVLQGFGSIENDIAVASRSSW